ncbi:aldo/keto reductase [Streptomyces sp. NPDC087894]|uniref:aldo/keto reductase n=1 Tax=Streptomyces sp. NPDC087894 TaxID=3365816 RepID=UPI0037F33334
MSGRYRTRDPAHAESSRPERRPHRHDPALEANRRKREAAEQLGELADEAGLPLIHLALAFVLEHPAVSSVIIGPRTQEHLASQLGAADVRLSQDVLDRIDEIVAPGVTISPADEGYRPRP